MYWLPNPFASFPFTSPLLHHLVPSGFKPPNYHLSLAADGMLLLFFALSSLTICALTDEIIELQPVIQIILIKFILEVVYGTALIK